MKLTDKEVIEHLKGNYYVRRKIWDKCEGICHDTQSFWFIAPLFELCGLRISLKDLEAEDWVLCPKE